MLSFDYVNVLQRFREKNTSIQFFFLFHFDPTFNGPASSDKKHCIFPAQIFFSPPTHIIINIISFLMAL